MGGERGPRGHDQVGVDLPARRARPEARECFKEHLRGEVLGVVLVADLQVEETVDGRHMVAVDAFPVERSIPVDHVEHAGLPGLRSHIHHPYLCRALHRLIPDGT